MLYLHFRFVYRTIGRTNIPLSLKASVCFLLFKKKRKKNQLISTANNRKLLSLAVNAASLDWTGSKEQQWNHHSRGCYKSFLFFFLSEISIIIDICVSQTYVCEAWSVKLIEKRCFMNVIPFLSQSNMGTQKKPNSL